MITVKEAFGQRLVVARFNFGRISQEALAERAGIHRTQMSLYESGRCEPMLETFVRLAGALDQTPDEVLEPIRWQPGTPGRFHLGDRNR